jgi:hypothetical protein
MTDKPAWHAIEKSAHQKIAELRNLRSLSDDDRQLLDRLKTDLRMRDVWTRLPHDVPTEIGAAIVAGALIVRIHQRETSTIPRYTFDGAARHAATLLSDMNAFKKLLSDEWASICPTISLDASLETLTRIEGFFRQLSEEHRAAMNSIRLPRGRKKTRDAPEVEFGRTMSRVFWDLFRRPLDEVVASLATVTFELDNPLDAVTIRGRRRSASPPIGTFRA